MLQFKIVTLGCKVNSYESQAIREMLIKEGFAESESPDYIIVNSCAVTKMAEHKSRQKVSALAKKYQAKIVVCGCSSQLHADKYVKIDGVCVVIGNNNHSDIPSLIKNYENSGNIQISVDKNSRLRKYQNIQISSFDEKVRAFVKISDGCNNFCSYCIIPISRGNLRSRDHNEILCEISRLVENGYQEIVLTGIDSASYGNENEQYKFNDLLVDILKVDGLKRLRISSIEASQMDDKFFSIVKNSNIIAHHLHIPLQSGSDTVLARMKRKYTCEEFYQKIQRLHKELPDVALACDVIVGFPGESEEEFEETYHFIEKCNFAFLHVFPYSIREGTIAASMPNQIDDKTKRERVKKLIELGRRLSEEYASKFEGKTLNVLIENYDKNKKMYHGLSENYLDVYVESEKDIINQIVSVQYSIKNKSGSLI